MGIHVIRSSRGATKVRLFLHPGEKIRPRALGSGKASGRPGATQTKAKPGEPTGTRGDFGADFE